MKLANLNNQTHILNHSGSLIMPTKSKTNHYALIGYQDTPQGFDIYIDHKMMNIQLITASSVESFDHIQKLYHDFDQVKHQFDCDGALIINLTELMVLLDNPHGLTNGVTQQYDCFMVSGSPTKQADLTLFYEQGVAYSPLNWDHANVEHVGLSGIFEQYAELFVESDGTIIDNDLKGMILTPNTSYLLKQWYWKMEKRGQKP